MFVKNWREVLRKGWSVRVAVLTYVLAGLSELWPALGGVISPSWFFAIGVPLFVLARVLDQGFQK